MSNKKIYTNTIAQIAGKFATGIISIFLIKIISVYLDASGYGMYSKIYNYLSIFAVLADLGLYTISVREMSQAQNNPKLLEKISGNILSLRTISGVSIMVLAMGIGFFLEGYNSPTAMLAIFIVSIFTLFGLINSSIMSYLQAILKTEFSFIANTAGKILTFLLVIFITFFAFPKGNISINEWLIYVLLAGLAGNILMTGLTYYHARKFQKIRYYWNTDYIIKILKMSIPYGIALFLGVIFFKIDTLLLSLMEEKNIADEIIGIYSVPMKIVEVGMMYGTIFLNSFLPVLTTAIIAKNSQNIKQLSSKWFELLFGFGVGISFFLALFAEKIIIFISSEKFLLPVNGFSGILALQIVAFVFLFYFISSLANYILIAQNEQKKIIYINLFIAIFNIIGNIIVIPKYSFIGAAFVTLLSQIILVIISLFLTRKNFDFTKIWYHAITLFLAGSMAWFFAFYGEKYFSLNSNFFSLLVAGIIFGSIFLGLWIFFTFFDKKFLTKKIP